MPEWQMPNAKVWHSAFDICNCRLLLGQLEVGHVDVDIVRDAQAGDAVHRLELAGADEVRLGPAADDRAVDLAVGLLRRYDPGDFLGHAAAGFRLLHRVARRAAAALRDAERRRAEA